MPKPIDRPREQKKSQPAMHLLHEYRLLGQESSDGILLDVRLRPSASPAELLDD